MLFKIRQMSRWWWQRRTRGWDDRELWNLDQTIAEFVLPRLRVFKTYRHGCPSELAEETWDSHLESMISAFELFTQPKYLNKPIPVEVQDGLDLFAKYYTRLWD